VRDLLREVAMLIYSVCTSLDAMFAADTGFAGRWSSTTRLVTRTKEST